MDKQRLLNLLSKNTYLQHFVTMVYKYEAGKTKSGKVNLGSFNESNDIKIGGNSTAFGAGQFTTATRNEVYNKYGVDAWSPKHEDQEAAMIALLDMRGVIDEVSVGNFKSLDREGLWETFRAGQPGYKPLNDPAALTDTIAVEEDLEAERMGATYAPDESLANLTPEVYAAKMKLYEKQMVFPFDAVQPFLNDNLGSLGDQYIEALDKAYAIGEEKKTELAVINTPDVETEKKETTTTTSANVTMPDISQLNRSQQDVFKKLSDKIKASDKNVNVKNELLVHAALLSSEANNLTELKRISKYDTSDFLRYKKNRDVKNIEDNAEIILNDPNVSFDERTQLEALLEARKNAKEQGNISYGTGLTEDSINRKLKKIEAVEKSNDDLVSFINNLGQAPLLR